MSAPVYALITAREHEARIKELEARVKQLELTELPVGWISAEASQWEGIERRAETAEARVKELEAQLPEGMKHCTIQFKECSLGHGWLTATNWVQYPCPACTLKSAESLLAALAPLEAAARKYKREADVVDGGETTWGAVGQGEGTVPSSPRAAGGEVINMLGPMVLWCVVVPTLILTFVLKTEREPS